MSYARVAVCLPLAGLYIAVCGPLRRVAQSLGSRFGRLIPVHFCRLLCAVLQVRVRRFGAQTSPARTLIVSNHISWLDILVLGGLEPMTFLAKKEVGKFWLGRQIAALQGVVYVDRQRKRSIPRTNADIAAAMAKGEPVVLFAEATTGDGNRLLKFRSSHFEAAREAARDGEVLAQPVFLHFTRLDGISMTRRERPTIAWYGDMLFLPHLFGIIRSGGVACDVYFGDPIRVADFSDRKALARATEAAVRRLAETAWRADAG